MGDKLLWVTSFALNSGAKFEPPCQMNQQGKGPRGAFLRQCELS